MMVSAMGVLIGLTAGLSFSIGFGGAMAIGIGASVGMFAAGRSMIKRANAMATTECTDGGKDVEEGKEVEEGKDVEEGEDVEEGKEEATADV